MSQQNHRQPPYALQYAPPERRGFWQWFKEGNWRWDWSIRFGRGHIVRAGEKAINLAHFVAAEMSPPGAPPRLVVYLAGGHRMEFTGEDAERLWAAIRAISPDVRTELRLP